MLKKKIAHPDRRAEARLLDHLSPTSLGRDARRVHAPELTARHAAIPHDGLLTGSNGPASSGAADAGQRRLSRRLLLP